MVGCIGDEAFWNFVKGDCGTGLKAYGKEDIGGNVVVMLRCSSIVRVVVA